jgi:hypothetical protein
MKGKCCYGCALVTDCWVQKIQPLEPAAKFYEPNLKISQKRQKEIGDRLFSAIGEACKNYKKDPQREWNKEVK